MKVKGITEDEGKKRRTTKKADEPMVEKDDANDVVSSETTTTEKKTERKSEIITDEKYGSGTMTSIFGKNRPRSDRTMIFLWGVVALALVYVVFVQFGGFKEPAAPPAPPAITASEVKVLAGEITANEVVDSINWVTVTSRAVSQLSEAADGSAGERAAAADAAWVEWSRGKDSASILAARTTRDVSPPIKDAMSAADFAMAPLKATAPGVGTAEIVVNGNVVSVRSGDGPPVIYLVERTAEGSWKVVDVDARDAFVYALNSAGGIWGNR